MLIWTDFGQDTDFSFIPTPDIDRFNGAVDRYEFCPVFSEKDLSEMTSLSRTASDTQSSRLRQALSSLPGNYGYTLDWTKAVLDPMFAIEELFTFHAVSELQYLLITVSKIFNHKSRGLVPRKHSICKKPTAPFAKVATCGLWAHPMLET